MKVGVINTGGTISCVGSPLAPMRAEEFARTSQRLLDPILLERYPDLTIQYVTDLRFPESKTHTLDSTNLQPSDWCRMARCILEHYDEVDGWVLLHGTDSMDYTGAALPFLLSIIGSNGVVLGAISKPIIITGSQVPMFYENPQTKDLSLNYNTDAYQNFCGAVAAAQSGVPEVCVYFAGNLFRGNRTVKVNASQFDAFASPNYPALGQYGIEFTIKPQYVLPPPLSSEGSLDNPYCRAAVIQHVEAMMDGIDTDAVMQFTAFPGWYNRDGSLLAKLIDAAVDQGIKGLILQSYGEGNFPSGNPDHPQEGSIYQALKRANDKGIFIVDCTQVLQGVVDDSAYASGAWLPEVGALNPADMTPMAAFAKLMVLMANTHFENLTPAQIRMLMQTNLLGEMMSVNRLDSQSNSDMLPNQSIAALDGSATLLNHPQQGPVLLDGNGTVLWQALNPPSPGRMPGRLVLEDDGNLVFYGRDSTRLWATETEGSPAFLWLDGSLADGSLRLVVLDYAANTVTRTLYPLS